MDSPEDLILHYTGADTLKEVETLQELWSGYGTVKRYHLVGSEVESVVVKHVEVPVNRNHPRGWNSDNSHQRKLKSYEIESVWYRDWSDRLGLHCYAPKSYGLQTDRSNSSFLMVLEDLDYAGFDKRKTSASIIEAKSCLAWLAHFHATFLGVSPEGLWETGTYWHLDTRLDELDALKDEALKDAASIIDEKLKNCPYQTFVHGDAKLANFCFSADGKKVAGVDFQYVGGGCGIKDVAYFIGSCFDELSCEKFEEELLEFYFNNLTSCFRLNNKAVNIDKLVESWRSLYPLAWADFHRFLKGWSPEHWKINKYSEQLTQNVLKSIM